MEISLIDTILGNNQKDVIKYVLYSEAEKNNVKIFTEYEKQIELEDIIYRLRVYVKNIPYVQRHMEGYDIRNISFIYDDEESETYKQLMKHIDRYMRRMGNKEVLKALR